MTMETKYYCIDCDKDIWRYSIRCKTCENFRGYRDNILQGGRYIDGRTFKKYYCINCGVDLSDYRHKRCKKCFGLVNREKNNYGWIGGKPKCINCDKQLSNYGSKRCVSCELKNRWQKLEYALQILIKARKTMKLKPNKPEKLLNKLLQKILPKEYKYVGNGQIFINRFNPDFINCNGQKKIIELFGNYWHNLETWKIRDKKKIRTYSQYGYKTLIIWEKELEDLNKVKIRILQFNKGSKK